MLYEIINPSDAVTFYANDVGVARFVVTVLGSGQYDGEDEKGEILGTMLFLMSKDEVAAQFREWFGEGGMAGFVEAHRKEIIAALESTACMNVKERTAYDQAIKLMTAENAAIYRKKVNDKNRTSLNNICGRAFDYAKKLRAESGDDAPPRAPRQVFAVQGGSH